MWRVLFRNETFAQRRTAVVAMLSLAANSDRSFVRDAIVFLSADSVRLICEK